jgi:hypothetical protein
MNNLDTTVEEILTERKLINTKQEIRELLYENNLNENDEYTLVIIYKNLNCHNVKAYRKTVKGIRYDMYNKCVENENNIIKDFLMKMILCSTILIIIYFLLQSNGIFIRQF